MDTAGSLISTVFAIFHQNNSVVNSCLANCTKNDTPQYLTMQRVVVYHIV
jgi:hypothetical protein